MSEFDPRDPERAPDDAEQGIDASVSSRGDIAADPGGEISPPVRNTPPPPPPPPSKPGIGRWVVGIVFGALALTILFVFLVVALIANRDESMSVTSLRRNKVAVVPINGRIVSSSTVIDQLSSFAGNRSIRAIVVRINSPGGAVAPSQEIHDEILRIRNETGKPVVASFATVAASGGYYIAVACDEIVANPGSITGSIGVIAQWFNLEELVEWAKLRPETFTSGSLKDAGSPYREMTPA